MLSSLGLPAPTLRGGPADVQRHLSSTRWNRKAMKECLQRRTTRISGRKLECKAWKSWGNGKGRGGEDRDMSSEQSSLDPKSTTRRRALLDFVQAVEPKVIIDFGEQAPATVVDAMRTTVSNMLGTIPPQYFEVKVSSTGENLAQLMFSVLLTGYMFKNGMFRMDLRNSMSGGGGSTGDVKGSLTGAQNSAASVTLDTESAPFAPGTQKRKIEGDVLRWHLASDSAESIPALEYIHMLERENAELKKQNGAAESRRQAGGGDNGLLAYLKGLEQENVEVLTRSASDDVIEAMNSFVQRMIGTSDLTEMRNQRSESNAVELAQLLYWLLVVGYSLRQMEVRHDMMSLGLSGPVDRLLPPGQA